MITTEREAKTKWCPLVRVRQRTGPGAAVGYNRTVYSTKENIKDWIYVRILPGPIYRYWAGVEYFRCQGRHCMSWRWVDRENGYCGEFGTPGVGSSIPHAAPPPQGTLVRDAVLMFVVGAAVGIIAWFALTP